MTNEQLIEELEKIIKIPALTKREFKQAEVIKEAISKLEECNERHNQRKESNR